MFGGINAYNSRWMQLSKTKEQQQTTFVFVFWTNKNLSIPYFGALCVPFVQHKINLQRTLDRFKSPKEVNPIQKVIQKR